MPRPSAYYHKGFISLAVLIIILMIGLTIGMGASLNSLISQEIVRNSLEATKSYYAGESGLEDAIYRIKNVLPYLSSYTLAVGSSQAMIAISSQGDTITVQSQGNRNNAIKTVVSTLKLSTQDAQFYYGVQVGEGGVTMDNNSVINGNVYSNGSITGNNGALIQGDVIVASGLAASPSVEWPMQNADQFFATNSGNRDIAQSFTASATGSLSQLKVYLGKVGSPSSNITARIATDNGGKPNTSSIANATIAPSSVGTAPSWITITFSTPPILTSGRTYWIILDFGSNSSSNYWNWRKDSSDGYAGHTGRYTSSWSSGSAVWTDVGGDLSFQVWIGGLTTQISNLTIGSTSSGSGRANAFINTTIHGSSCPNSYCIVDTPPQQSLPISDGVIQDWKDAATAGGMCGPPACDASGNYDLNAANGTLGPIKIIGNLSLNNGAQLTLNGVVWVLGTVTLKNNSVVRLPSSFGTNSGIMIAGDTLIVNNNVAFSGSGQAGSYVMLLSAKNDPLSQVMDINNNSTGVIYYASTGRIALRNNASAKEVIGYGLDMSNNSTITYETGLENIQFSSGPGGSFQILDWKEK